MPHINVMFGIVILIVWTDKSDDQSYMNNLIANAPDLHCWCCSEKQDPTTTGALPEGIYYTTTDSEDDF